MKTRVLAIFVLSLIGNNLSEGCDESPEFDVLTEEKQSRSDQWKYRSWKSRFQELTETQLRTLSCSSNNNVAINASWELVGRATSKKELKLEKMRFLGQMEGRLKASFPPWFKSFLRRLEVYEFDSAIKRVGRDDDTNPSDKIQLADENYVFPGRVRDLRIPVRKLQGDADLNSLNYVSENGQFWIVSFNQVADEYPIACHSYTSAKLWQESVWAMIHSGSFSGDVSSNFHHVGVISTDEGIVAFGAHDTGCYCEVFKKETGECLVRFLTTYGG